MKYIKFCIIVSAIFLMVACSGDDQTRGDGGGAVIPSVEAVQARFGSLPPGTAAEWHCGSPKTGGDLSENNGACRTSF